MSHQTISATTLARNFSEFLNRVRYQGVTLDVTRGSDLVACIIPPGPAGGFPIEKLDPLFASLPRLDATETKEFEADIAAVLGQLRPESDAWAS